MRKQNVSLLLVVVVLGSTFALLDSANPLNTVTKTYTSTYTSALTKWTTVSTVYATYEETEQYTGIIFFVGSYSHLVDDFKAGDRIVIEAYGEGAVRTSDARGKVLQSYAFYRSDYITKKTFFTPVDGTYEIYYDGLVDGILYRNWVYSRTSSSLVVEQYTTSFLAESTFTKTEIVTGWYESPLTIIAIVAVVAVAIVIAFMKRRPKPEQTQLEKYA